MNKGDLLMQTMLNNYQCREGLHFYINIKNFNNLVATDEKDGDMSHMFHLLNTFLVTLERYIRDNFDTDKVFVEKLTGSRIHIIIYGKCADSFKYFLNISSFAFKLSDYIASLPKYKTLPDIALQVGADFGMFYDFVFEDKDKKLEEYTSIGHPANFACKLQSLADAGEIIVSKRISDNISLAQSYIVTPLDNKRQSTINDKYPGSGNEAYIVEKSNRKHFFESLNNSLMFESLDNKEFNFKKYSDLADRIAEKTSYGDMDTIEPNKMNFSNWNIKRSAKLNAAVVFADVRDFTKKFDPNGSNLKEMSEITRKVLNCMYENCEKRNGVHIQFQGDREFAFFPESEVKNAIVFALNLRKEIRSFYSGIEVGIGIHCGKVYASQIGLESEDNNFVKQNIMIGNTINKADTLEDQCAKRGEIVVSDDVYNRKELDKTIRNLFEKRNYYWVTKRDFDDYIRVISNDEYKRASNENTYKPWSH